MRARLLFVIPIALCALTSTPSVAAAQRAFASSPAVPAMPEKLTVEEGYEVFLVGHAVGTQNYICLPAATGAAWKFIGPQATLTIDLFRDFQQQVSTHFLSENPDESGVARPTWQHSLDSSRVWGAVLETSSDADFVAPGAIPWLKLRVAGKAFGPEGGSALTPAKFIQRLNTAGGTAPAIGCGQASDIGVLALVPYSADYFFYRTSRER